MSIILGLDPGTSTIGYGVIEKTGAKITPIDWGIISTPPNMPLEEKLQLIGTDLLELLKLYPPAIAGIEELFFTKNIKTGIAVAHSRGVLCFLLAQKGIPIQEWTPSEVKQGICKNGRANKKQIQKTIQILFHLDEIPTPDDAADALAIAYITALHTR